MENISASTTSIGATTFSYDGKGHRIQAIRGGITTRYIYDQAGNLLAEADGNNVIQKYYVYGAGLVAMVTASNDIYCYHYNATGSTVAVTDQSRVVVNKYSYDPYGNILSQQEAKPQPFKYVGQLGVMAEANGFYYMRARYYDPQVGRFISEDPIGFEGGDVNLMAYVGNNPVMGVDPEGKAANVYHFLDGFRVGFSIGNGWWDGLKTGYRLGKAAMAPDGYPNKTNPQYHATTTNIFGSPQAAINSSLSLASKQWQSGSTEGMGNAIHIWRDIASHAGSYFPDPASIWDYTKHIVQRDLRTGGSFSSVIGQRVWGNGSGGK